jgi:hypothetical protein
MGKGSYSPVFLFGGSELLQRQKETGKREKGKEKKEGGKK